MKTQIKISFTYGMYSIAFKREFDLPFTPFYGMGIVFDYENEYEVRLENNDYCSTLIDYNIEEERFVVWINKNWKHPVHYEVINDLFLKFSTWICTNNDSIKMKELSKKDAEMSKLTGVYPTRTN